MAEFIERIDKLKDTTYAGHIQHKDLYGEEVNKLIATVYEKFMLEWSQINDLLIKESVLERKLSSCQTILNNYIPSLLWTQWDIYDFGPPLAISPDDDYPIALIYYLGGRLMDDGIDGHCFFKNGKEKSLFGHLKDSLDEREAAALSVLMGTWVCNLSMRRLLEKGFLDSAKILLRLSSVVCPGILAESLAREELTPDIYKAVVSRKSIAYNMMYYQIFVLHADQKNRALVLAILASLGEINQWLSDLLDEADDRLRDQVNILSVPDMDRRTVMHNILQSLEETWHRSATLPSPLRDAVASRIYSLIKVMQQQKIIKN